MRYGALRLLGQSNQSSIDVCCIYLSKERKKKKENGMFHVHLVCFESMNSLAICSCKGRRHRFTYLILEFLGFVINFGATTLNYILFLTSNPMFG